MFAFISRVRIKLHVVAVAFAAALPILLDQLGYIDLKPLLSRFMPEDWVSLVVALMPFVLAFLRPLVHVEPQVTHDG